METALLMDIGSTYTKVSLVDLDKKQLIARNQSFTTVQAGINIGLKKALAGIPNWQRAKYKLACSSAAGGLKLVAIGLVPELTAEAAKRAALGAGSKVIKTYSYQLTTDDLIEIEKSNPDLILLAGGTDGGNKKSIIENAQKLAETSLSQPIIVAGNRNATEIVEKALRFADKEVYITENVMPELEKLNIEPARKMIRDLFLKKIIEAKGLKAVNEIIDGIIMPTPSAVLKAARLLADGYGDEKGIGELIIVDIGGATIDIHSIASGEPQKKNTTWQGLEEPYVKRTVEGDLGMRYSLSSLLAAIDVSLLEKQLKELANGTFTRKDCVSLVEKLSQEINRTTKGRDKYLEALLAYNGVRIAVGRHVGRMKTIYTPLGAVSVQEGKDLTEIKYLIGTGGIIVNNDQSDYILSGAFYAKQQNPEILAPVKPKVLIDRQYILAAAGLLAEVEPKKSLQFMKNSFKYILERN